MDTPSPALTDAFGLLRNEICRHLDEAEFLATQDDEWSADDMDTARRLIGDLVLTLRGLLIEHALQTSGDCRICTQAWPCPVVTSIHASVKDPHHQFIALVARAKDCTC